jgi:hypothetical protein
MADDLRLLSRESGERITATVGQFCEMSGMGKTKVFGLIKNGTLASIKIGQTRLIVLDSYRRLIAEQAGNEPPQTPWKPCPTTGFRRRPRL